MSDLYARISPESGFMREAKPAEVAAAFAETADAATFGDVVKRMLEAEHQRGRTAEAEDALLLAETATTLEELRAVLRARLRLREAA